MKQRSAEQLAEIAKRYGSNVDGLDDELKAKLAATSARASVVLKEVTESVAGADPELPAAPHDDFIEERIIAVTAGARPVARILNNQVTADFIGPDSESWGKAILTAKPLIDKAIPAVGRIELNNSDYPWAGTGWLIAPGVIVTNRHVAEVFARTDRKTRQLVFKPGLLSGLVSADIDFLEEENRLDSNEHPITSIMWIAPAGEADVAFLRVNDAPGRTLPSPIELADAIEEEAVIAAIGYPARDPSIRDQQLVIKIFGADVYDKKRLSPGKVMSVSGNQLKHDCSTLGGNSGSVLLDLKTGRAIGLHRAGLVDDTANLGVTAPYLGQLLARAVQAGGGAAPEQAADGAGAMQPPREAAATPGSYRIQLQVPIEIIVNVGSPVQAPGGTVTLTSPQGWPVTSAGQQDALQVAKALLAANPDVLEVRYGWRFKNGWITDERVIVVEVREKLAFGALQKKGVTPLPREILGIGVDVRTAPLPDQLEALGIGVALEQPATPAGYKEPPGYNDVDSEMYLGRVKEKMDAIFHVSPDVGLANLTAFFSRVESHLTATMYEWQSTPISNALAAAITPSDRKLRMVTQKDGTKAAVEDMKQRLGGKFKHVWASVEGPHKLIPRAYHIKVASRDGEEVWLSSGNWKKSNQPPNPAMPAALEDFNREWHVIVKNKRLATLFQKYIEFDFKQANLFPLVEHDHEAVAAPDTELFVPLAPVALETVPAVTYSAELKIVNEELDIQPLLTPDRDSQGDRMFMKFATDMVQRATSSVLIQNQSFTYTAHNNQEFDDFFEAVKQKQNALPDVRIIFRDAKDFPDDDALIKQQKLIERLKDHGLDVSKDKLRLQSKCHTKGIIIDSKEVMLGSQNLTNEGSLFNRDASLLVRSPKVAAFYEKIFNYDWDKLAHNEADESVAGIRLARPGEPTPAGFARVRLSDLLAGG